MKLAAPGTFDALPLSAPVTVRGVSEVNSPAIDLGESRSNRRVRIDATDISLSQLDVPANAWVDLAIAHDSLSLAIEPADSATVASIELGGRVEVSADADVRAAHPARMAAQFETPETVLLSSGVTSGGKQAPSFELVARGLRLDSEIGGVLPATIRFVERSSSSALHSPFGGSVLRGRLSLPDTNEAHDLHDADLLSIDGLTVDQARFTLGSDIRVRLFGSATSVRLRSGGVERSLAPSWLAFLAQNHGIAFLWGACTFIWGLFFAIYHAVSK